MSLLRENRRLVRDVDTVQEFTDILVPYPADTLDRRGFEGVSACILCIGRSGIPDCETF